MKKKPDGMMGTLCFYLRIFEKNRSVMDKIKPLFDLKKEQKNFKNFLIENIFLNFNDYKEKMKHGVKGKYELRDIELMILLISDDFKLLKSPETAKKCLEIELFRYLFEEQKANIMNILDENDLLLNSETSNKIYQYILSKSAQTASLEDILNLTLNLKTNEERESFILDVLNTLEEKINLKRGVLEQELDFDRLTTFAIERKKSALIVNKIELICKYLKMEELPYKSIFVLFQNISHKPLEILDSYSKNPNKNDKNLNLMLNEILNLVLSSIKILGFEEKIKNEVLDCIRIFDKNDDIQIEIGKINEILSFLFYLKISNEFQNYKKNSKAKLFKIFIKHQISLLWDMRLKEFVGYEVNEIEKFFIRENLLAEAKKYQNELNVMNFQFMVFWNLNEMKSNEKCDFEGWENEIKKILNTKSVAWKDVLDMMGLGEENMEEIIDEICEKIVGKLLKNVDVLK